MDFSKIKIERALEVSLIITSVTLPIIWFLYDFYPALFHKLDTIKLILFSASIGIPILFINSFYVIAIFTLIGKDLVKSGPSTLDLYRIFTISSFFNYFTVFTPALISFVTRTRITDVNAAIRKGLVVHAYIFSGFLFSVLVVYIIDWYAKRNKSTKRKS